MKKIILAIAIIFTANFMNSCREKETKVIVEEKTVEVKEEDKGILERVGEEVDKEVNEEIDKTIDKIGNDD
ncbi:MAG: hypothetical protein R2786_05605 [Flavobacteriaceae bacterium]